MEKDPIMKFFGYDHLPERLQPYSKPFGELAAWIMERALPGEERAAALRKLLEAKDAFVRAAL